MIYFYIISAVLVFLVWKNRKRIDTLIKTKLSNKKKPTTIATNKDSIFSPVGTKRTFAIFLDIEEKGGDIKITLAKQTKDNII